MNRPLSAVPSTARRVLDGMRRNRTTFQAAAVTFYALLSVFPAVVATLSIYSLFADAATLASELEGLAHILPDSAAGLIVDEIELLVSGPVTHAGIGAVVSILITLWTASTALKALSLALDGVYGVDESRPYPAQRAVSYLLTLGLVAGLIVQGVLVITAPGWLRAEFALEAVRWPVLFSVLVVVVALLYRLAPNRRWRESRWGWLGASIGAGGLVLSSLAVSIYARHSANLNAAYGALAGVIVLMLWFYATTVGVLVGAEVDAALDDNGTAPATP